MGWNGWKLSRRVGGGGGKSTPTDEVILLYTYNQILDTKNTKN